jgi:hypothetical protein
MWLLALVAWGMEECFYDYSTLDRYCSKSALLGYRMDLPGPTTSVGTRTDYSVAPWDCSTWVTRHLMAWGARTTVEEYSDRRLCRVENS